MTKRPNEEIIDLSEEEEDNNKKIKTKAWDLDEEEDDDNYSFEDQSDESIIQYFTSSPERTKEGTPEAASRLTYQQITKCAWVHSIVFPSALQKALKEGYTPEVTDKALQFLITRYRRAFEGPVDVEGLRIFYSEILESYF